MNIKSQFIDKILWVLLHLIIACSFIFIANDNSFYAAIKVPSFKTDFLFAIITTYLVLRYLKWISHKLNKTISRNNFKERIKQQIFKGVIIPLVIAMGLEMIYLQLINIPISKSSIFNLELPLTLLFLLLINTFYLASYLFHNKKMETITVVKNNIPKVETIRHIMVQKGYSEEKVNIENCAFIKSSNKTLWLYTFDGNCFQLNGTLEEWQKKLAPIFFKINRQYIVAPNSIKSIEKTDTRKIKVLLSVHNEEGIFISKVNASSFKNWWEHISPS